MSKRNNKAFTIIELLIVIVVIGILAGLVLNVISNLDDRAETVDATARYEQTRKSLISSALIDERSSWWSEDELETCSTGTVSSDPYLDEIIAGCPEIGRFIQTGDLTLNKQNVRLRYDNDQNGSSNLLSSCGSAGEGVNLSADFDDVNLIAEIDKKIDGSDGNNCGRFRWSTASSELYYILAGDETKLQ